MIKGGSLEGPFMASLRHLLQEEERGMVHSSYGCALTTILILIMIDYDYDHDDDAFSWTTSQSYLRTFLTGLFATKMTLGASIIVR